ncbi:MAG: hypothetical protein KatS3mg108_3548 [Isosphaeraceae bacterium]|jgi:RNA polymerase sigma factor (sigma-70 family)|nr:MAG: hypothetical protein KatS3mg108_3548 [Isosphaeraceae bacterium]
MNASPGYGPSLSPDDLNGLLPRMRGGDEHAWRLMFEACYPKVQRAIRARMTSRAMRSLYDSTDLANDVWKSLAGNWNRYHFESVDALMSFLLKEADCKLKDASRRHHTRKRDCTREQPLTSFEREGQHFWEPTSDEPTASQVVAADETRQQLLARLDPDERMVVELRGHGYSTEEIAERVGWHVRKVQRLLQSLERHWRRHGGGSAA